MSGICAVAQWDPHVPVRDRLDVLMTAIRHRGRDRAGTWIDGGAALGHTLLATTPEARGEQQPVTDRESGLVLVMDGRIDDRAALINRLPDAGTQLRTSTDAELALLAFKQWGAGCMEYLLGDHAIVVWDSRRRELSCLRDATSPVPLYYSITPGGVVVASEAGALTRDSQVRTDANLETVRAHLEFGDPAADATLYRDVKRLPPGCAAVFREGASRVWRWWDPLRRSTSTSSNLRDCAHEYRHLLRTAVADRLRSTGHVSAELSGGLDSSAVCVLASEVLAEEGRDQLQAWTIADDDAPWNETSYSRAVRGHVALGGAEVRAFQPTLDTYAEIAREARQAPGYPNGLFRLELLQRVRQSGSRVLLTGLWGDTLLEGTPFDLVDHLLHGRLRTLRRLLRDGGDRAAFARDLVRSVALLVSPRGWATISAARRTNAPDQADWLGPRLPKRRKARIWGWQPSVGRRVASASLARALTLNDIYWLSDLYEPLESRQGVECRHPFLDRRLVEYTLALPAPVRCGRGQTKRILRRALGSRLPSRVRRRSDKAEFSELFLGALRAVPAGSLGSNSQIAQNSWIRHAAMQRLVRTTASDRRFSWRSWAAWGALGLEFWQRGLEDPA